MDQDNNTTPQEGQTDGAGAPTPVTPEAPTEGGSQEENAGTEGTSETNE